MRSTLLCLILMFVSFDQHAGSEKRPVEESFALFVGEWNMNLLTHQETFGERGGPGTGTMVCSWGLSQAWVDCELDSQYEGIGPYVLKIVLYRSGNDGMVGAFVTNSFGGGRLYKGQWLSDSKLVFKDAWIDPDRKWEYQLTTYSFEGSENIEYMIEVSSDDEHYLPHSSGSYTRK